MTNNEITFENYDEVINIIEELIYSTKTSDIKLDDITFHHQLPIERITSVLDYGILCSRLRVELVEKREPREMEKMLWNRITHACGENSISLSNARENSSKLWLIEFFYNTYDSINPDIIVSKKTNPYRKKTNYFNEFLVDNKIDVDMFNSIDLRILKIKNYNYNLDPKLENIYRAKAMLNQYKYLKEIASKLKEKNLDIPLRETSLVNRYEDDYKAITLDKEKILKLPNVKIK